MADLDLLNEFMSCKLWLDLLRLPILSIREYTDGAGGRLDTGLRRTWLGSIPAEEELDFRPSSISEERSLSASRAPCSLNLSHNRSIALEESWSAVVRVQNNYRDLGWWDRYHQASSINLSYKTNLGKTLSYLETAAQFNGTADRRGSWVGGFIDQRLVGNFTQKGEARWRFASKSKSAAVDKDELDCGMEIREWVQNCS